MRCSDQVQPRKDDYLPSTSLICPLEDVYSTPIEVKHEAFRTVARGKGNSH